MLDADGETGNYAVSTNIRSPSTVLRTKRPGRITDLMHQERNFLSNLSREEQDAIELLRALLAQTEHRRSAIQSILERGVARSGQVAISRLSALLVIAGFDIKAPGESVVSQDERALLDILGRAQLRLRLTKPAILEEECNASKHLSTILQDEMEACARALARIGICLLTDGKH
ncbi:MAG: hypothetical protein WCY11_00115 [Novosphingobium sp.]